MKKETIVFALLLVASCSLGVASKALAGKGGSSNTEEELKTINYINQLNQNKQQPAPVQEKPAPSPTPPPPPPA